MAVEKITPQLVKKGKGKKRPGYRGPGGYQGSSGGSKASSGGSKGTSNTGGAGNQNTGNARDDYRANYSSRSIVKGGGTKKAGGGYNDAKVSGDRGRSSAREFVQQLNNNNAVRAAQTGQKFTPYKGGSRPQGGSLGGLGSLIMSGLGMLMGIPGLGLITGGLGSLGNKLGDTFGNFNETMRGINPKTGKANTQAEYEAMVADRKTQSRIDKMQDRINRGYNQIGFGDFTKTTGPITDNQRATLAGLLGQKDRFGNQFGPSTAQNVLTGRDLKGFTPSRMGLQTIDRPTQTFSFDSSGMMKNQPTMMEEFYSNLDNRVTGPNVVPNASDLAIQAKTFNTPEALKGMAGATEPGTLYGTNLSDQGKALEDFRNSAVNFYNSPNNSAKTAQGAYNFMMGTNPTMFKDVKENKSFIQDAINQGFLQTEDDYANQVPLDQIDLKDGGIASMFTRRG